MDKLLLVNGVLSLVGVLLLVCHMNEHWGRIGQHGHQVWYMCLFGYAVLVAGASAENLAYKVDYKIHHAGSTFMSVMLILAVAYAIRLDRKDRSENFDE